MLLKIQWRFIWLSFYKNALNNPKPIRIYFSFCEDAFMQLDVAENEVTANFPIYFAMQLAHFFGLSIQDNYSTERNYFNISEGFFTNKPLANDNYLEPDISYHFSQLLKVLHPSDLKEIKLNKSIRAIIYLRSRTITIFILPILGL